MDIKSPEFYETDADEFEILGLRRWYNCLLVARGVDEVYAMTVGMGDMDFK